MEFDLTEDGKIYARGVDLKRMAKKALDLRLATDQSRSLDLIAQLMGQRNFHALRQSAQHVDQDKIIRTKHAVEAFEHVRDKAIHRGDAFPEDLPERFTPGWKKHALQLLDGALAQRTPGTLNFVALVGACGSGKTILAKAHCAQRGSGSRVIDTGLYSWFLSRYKPSAGDVVYMDRPASTKVLSDHKSRGMVFFPQYQEWDATPPHQRTLQRASQIFSIDHLGIPYDDMQSYSHGEPIPRKLARDCSLVIAFPTVEAVQAALDQAGTVLKMGGPKSISAPNNWGAAHVVNLDDMTSCTLHRTDGEFAPSAAPAQASAA